jgi:hypothetical protein
MRIHQVVVFGFVACLATQALADVPPYPQGGAVNCTDAKATNGPVVWSYGMNKTPSVRLATDIVYNPGTGNTVISALMVAQYEASTSELFMLLDDLNQKPTFVFEAKNPATNGKAIKATLSVYTNGQVTSTQSLMCNITP